MHCLVFCFGSLHRGSPTGEISTVFPLQHRCGCAQYRQHPVYPQKQHYSVRKARIWLRSTEKHGSYGLSHPEAYTSDDQFITSTIGLRACHISSHSLDTEENTTRCGPDGRSPLYPLIGCIFGSEVIDQNIINHDLCNIYSILLILSPLFQALYSNLTMLPSAYLK